MAKLIPSTITLKGEGIQKEDVAHAIITPGDLVERVVVSTVTGVRKHSTAAANARKMFALEFIEIGRGIDDNYAAGERCLYSHFHSGEEVLARLAAGATAVTVGAALESAGDGTLRVAAADAATDTTQRDSIVGYAKEAVDNSAGVTPARIRVMVA
jgi:pyruvoyl-dependent arginine decarboxylase (PvlArgDC)